MYFEDAMPSLITALRRSISSSASELGVCVTCKNIFSLFRSCSVSLSAKGAVMSRIAAIFLALISPAAFGETYTLVFDSKCSSSGEKLEFSCKSDPAFWAQNTTIFLHNGKWLGIEGASQRAFPLSLIKHDEYVMVFDYPVLYSGIATIVLIKKTGRFYMSEFSYSNALKVQDATIEAGRFSVGKLPKDEQ